MWTGFTKTKPGFCYYQAALIMICALTVFDHQHTTTKSSSAGLRQKSWKLIFTSSSLLEKCIATSSLKAAQLKTIIIINSVPFFRSVDAGAINSYYSSNGLDESYDSSGDVLFESSPTSITDEDIPLIVDDDVTLSPTELSTPKVISSSNGELGTKLQAQAHSSISVQSHQEISSPFASIKFAVEESAWKTRLYPTSFPTASTPSESFTTPSASRLHSFTEADSSSPGAFLSQTSKDSEENATKSLGFSIADPVSSFQEYQTETPQTSRKSPLVFISSTERTVLESKDYNAIVVSNTSHSLLDYASQSDYAVTDVNSPKISFSEPGISTNFDSQFKETPIPTNLFSVTDYQGSITRSEVAEKDLQPKLTFSHLETQPAIPSSFSAFYEPPSWPPFESYWSPDNRTTALQTSQDWISASPVAISDAALQTSQDWISASPGWISASPVAISDTALKTSQDWISASPKIISESFIEQNTESFNDKSSAWLDNSLKYTPSLGSGLLIDYLKPTSVLSDSQRGDGISSQYDGTISPLFLQDRGSSFIIINSSQFSPNVAENSLDSKLFLSVGESLVSKVLDEASPSITDFQYGFGLSTSSHQLDASKLTDNDLGETESAYFLTPKVKLEISATLLFSEKHSQLVELIRPSGDLDYTDTLPKSSLVSDYIEGSYYSDSREIFGKRELETKDPPPSDLSLSVFYTANSVRYDHSEVLFSSDVWRVPILLSTKNYISQSYFTDTWSARPTETGFFRSSVSQTYSNSLKFISLYEESTEPYNFELKSSVSSQPEQSLHLQSFTVNFISSQYNATSTTQSEDIHTEPTVSNIAIHSSGDFSEHLNYTALSSLHVKSPVVKLMQTTKTDGNMSTMPSMDSVAAPSSSITQSSVTASSNISPSPSTINLESSTPVLRISKASSQITSFTPPSLQSSSVFAYDPIPESTPFLTSLSPQPTVWSSSPTPVLTTLTPELTQSHENIASSVFLYSSNKGLQDSPQQKSASVVLAEEKTLVSSSYGNTSARMTMETPYSSKLSAIKPSSVFSSSSFISFATSATPGVNTTAPSTRPNSPGGRSNSTSVSGSDHSSEIIIGSAAAVFILAALVLGVILCLRWKKRAPKKSGARQDDLWMDNLGTGSHMIPLPSLTTCVSEAAAPARRENIYTVAFPYQPLQDGQLSLHKGDKLELVETADNGWWRGVSVKKGKSGWFPSSYVTAAENGSSENLGNVSSSDDISGNLGVEINGDLERQISSFQIKKTPQNRQTTEDAILYPAVEEQKTLNDVESWVNMAASISMMSLPTTEMSYNTNLTDFTAAPVTGQRFRAVYAYKPVNRGEMGLKEGELVTCQEKDRNGWMLGRKTRSGEQGWFPAVYVDQVSSDDESISDPEIPDTYDLLDSNKLHKVDQTFLGIDHEVVCPFTSPVPGDMALDLGDTVTVLQTLANGWWFGVKGTECGWFPGSFLK
ncbi:intersectin-1, partial [Plakobranchus ocellatus]